MGWNHEHSKPETEKKKREIAVLSRLVAKRTVTNNIKQPERSIAMAGEISTDINLQFHTCSTSDSYSSVAASR